MNAELLIAAETEVRKARREWRKGMFYTVFFLGAACGLYLWWAEPSIASPASPSRCAVQKATSEEAVVIDSAGVERTLRFPIALSDVQLAALPQGSVLGCVISGDYPGRAFEATARSTAWFILSFALAIGATSILASIISALGSGNSQVTSLEAFGEQSWKYTRAALSMSAAATVMIASHPPIFDEIGKRYFLPEPSRRSTCQIVRQAAENSESSSQFFAVEMGTKNIFLSNHPNHPFTHNRTVISGEHDCLIWDHGMLVAEIPINAPIDPNALIWPVFGGLAAFAVALRFCRGFFVRKFVQRMSRPNAAIKASAP